jgi:outer membrane biosynthesis protein TonB
MMLPYCERLKISELKDLGIKTARLAEMKRKFCETYQTLDQLKILQLRVLCKKWKAPLPATKPLLIAGLRGIMAQHMQKTKATASDDIDQIDDSAAEIEQPDEEEGEEESEKEDGKEIIKNENENMGEVNKKGKMPLADDMPKDRSDSQKKKDKKPNKKPQAKPDSAKNGEQSSTSKATPSGSKVASSGPGDNPAPSSTSTIQKCPVKCTYSGGNTELCEGLRYSEL